MRFDCSPVVSEWLKLDVDKIMSFYQLLLLRIFYFAGSVNVLSNNIKIRLRFLPFWSLDAKLINYIIFSPVSQQGDDCEGLGLI